MAERASDINYESSFRDDIMARPRPDLASKKRLRIDEDFTEEVVHTKIAYGDAKSTAAGVSGSHIDVSEATARTWERDDCLLRQATAIQTFEKPKQTHIAEDGSRIGCPAEETIVYLGWESDSNCGFTLAPQVFDVCPFFLSKWGKPKGELKRKIHLWLQSEKYGLTFNKSYIANFVFWDLDDVFYGSARFLSIRMFHFRCFGNSVFSFVVRF